MAVKLPTERGAFAQKAICLVLVPHLGGEKEWDMGDGAVALGLK